VIRDAENLSSRWLLQQLGRKLRHFPRDYSRRLRRSLRKRRSQPSLVGRLASLIPDRILEVRGTGGLFDLADLSATTVDGLARSRTAGQAAALQDLMTYHEMARLVADAASLDPLVGSLSGREPVLVPPGHDKDYAAFRNLRACIPEGRFESVVLMPAGRVGGADYVAALLAKALAQHHSVLILRTDDIQWERPDWFPSDAPSIDISAHLASMPSPTRALYLLLSEIGAINVFNVNSRTCFETFSDYGLRLATEMRLHSYYFCADHSPDGLETGYPVWYFATQLPYLTTAIMDNDALRRTLINRFAVPESEKGRIKLVYTPAQSDVAAAPVAGIDVAAGSAARRPRIVWAGRLDRQKRFDLLVEVARAMPDVDFLCWGKAVLDAPPDFSSLPANVRMQGAFASFDDLQLAQAEGFFYTAAWDGLPTILIELGALGVPIVASAVGGVPELIDEGCGWSVPGDSGADAYVAALRHLISDPGERVARARRLQHKVAARHSWPAFAEHVAQITRPARVS
jgi:glycosyltransferase involved in cell wall biosynthesis